MANEGTTRGEGFDLEDLNTLDAFALTSGFGGPPIGEMCERQLAAGMSRVDPVHAATTFGALLLAPALQGNCLRLEVLVHLAVALGGGEREASDTFVANAFASMGGGACGWMEDPAEDVFVGTVRSPRGNFRVLEGIWEGNAFYLQRFLDVIERMPSASGYEEIRSNVNALLRLSEIACDRASLPRHHLGGEVPLARIEPDVLGQLPGLRASLRFTSSDLRSAGIDPRHLDPFTFRPSERSALMGEQAGHSSLERRPLLRDPAGVVFVLPTAVSSAIRRLVVERMSAAGMRTALAKGLANAYAAQFNRMPFLGGPVGAPLAFSPDPTPVAQVMWQIDVGRFQHAVLFADGLDAFDEAGLAGMNPAATGMADVIEHAARKAFESASTDPAYVGGLTLVIGCGIGRVAAYAPADPPGPGWRVEAMSAYDFHTLSWLEGFNPMKLWRILELRDGAEALGLSVRNLNGLINLIGWARTLGGDLVPHGQLPDDAIEAGKSFLMMIDQASQRLLRHEAAVSRDQRVAPHPGMGMLRITKDAASAFDDDKAAPLYATDEMDDGPAPRSAYLAPKRTWWAELELREGTPGPLAYERWRGVAMWLARAAPILDPLPGLPDGPVVWRAVFEADLGEGPHDGGRMTYERARQAIRVEVDPAAASVITRASAAYEDAAFHPENIAERALMDALISGIARLAGPSHDDEAGRAALLASLVPNSLVRHGHAFRANRFRERSPERLLGRVVKVSDEDVAIVKLGFGWRARSRADGSRVEGTVECLAFLGELVQAAEDDLCAYLRQFDRRSILGFLLRNMEEAAADRDRWERTAAAVLALHTDRQATLGTMARHEFGLNAVFQASRILVEVAICESPLGAGRPAGNMDVSLLMATANQLFESGGWSDAIRWGVMEPSLRITPLGDVHANLGFVHEILTPHARVTSERRFSKAADDYGDGFEEIEPKAATNSLDPAFSDAWTEEFDATFDETRLFMDVVEHLGSQTGGLLTEVSVEAIAAVTLGGRAISRRTAANLVRCLTLETRPSWRDTPRGFIARDRHPWRYRRRLSLLRRPLLKTDPTSETLLVAPGMLREAFAYMLGNFMRGDFPDEQLKPLMRAHKARVTGARGAVFSKELARALEDRGWKAETEVKMTKLLRRGFERDYGDVDVLAWQPASGRLLVIECKDVQFRKTYGEMAEQLAEFRGGLRPNGKPDYLRRHLDRIELIGLHGQEAAAYVDAPGRISIESHLVFRNPVPMEFALSSLREKVSVTNFDDLDKIM